MAYTASRLIAIAEHPYNEVAATIQRIKAQVESEGTMC